MWARLKGDDAQRLRALLTAVIILSPVIRADTNQPDSWNPGIQMRFERILLDSNVTQE